MKLFLATTLTNTAQAQVLATVLEANGHQVTFRWWDELPEHPNSAWLSRRAVDDLAAVRLADALVLVQPGRLGAHVELGAALVLGKPVILLEDGEKAEREVCYWHHPRVHRIAKGLRAVVVGQVVAHLEALELAGLEAPADDAVAAAQRSSQEMGQALKAQATFCSACHRAWGDHQETEADVCLAQLRQQQLGDVQKDVAGGGGGQ